MNADRKWLGKTQGKLKVLAIVRESVRGRAALYRCRCACGRYTAVSGYELQNGISDCGCSRTQAKEEEILLRSTSLGVPKTLMDEYLLKRHMCPAWWATSLSNVIEAMCNMLARGYYTHEYMAEWWRCPVGFVKAVEATKQKRIAEIREELDEVRRIYASAIANPPPDSDHRLGEKWGGIASLRMALSPRSHQKRLSRGNTYDY